MSFADNEDWLVLQAIYGEETTSYREITMACTAGSQGDQSDRAIRKSKIIASIELDISINFVAFVCRESLDYRCPSYRYLTVDRSPHVRINFFYDSMIDCTAVPHSSTIDILDYPNIWPATQADAFHEWLQNKADNILHECGQSYAVCDFVQHRALEFWGFEHHDSQNGYALILLPPIEHELSETGANIIYPLATMLEKEDRPSNPKQYARLLLKDLWQNHYQVDCPICLDNVPMKDSFRITCDHIFCRECIETYVQFKVEELVSARYSPFVCPLTDCRQPMLLIGCVKKLLSTANMDNVRTWMKDMKSPPCWSLDRCLSLKCGGIGCMRRVNPDHPSLVAGKDLTETSHHVYCDDCGGTWCELCLRKIDGAKHIQTCNPTKVVQFCQRYLNAPNEMKVKCETRYPWIKLYARAATHDAAAQLWVKQNGQICPGCSYGVQRSEGCFHISCHCGTHFCYECGTQLFPPFYGTHHCWLQEGDAFLDLPIN